MVDRPDGLCYEVTPASARTSTDRTFLCGYMRNADDRNAEGQPFCWDSDWHRGVIKD
jgi:hypothetical protein